MSTRTIRLFHLPVVLLVAISLLLVSASSFAQNSFDPRSMAMGGTGVAIANPATAPFFNPAVLSLEKRERFSIEVPTVGVRIYDPNEFVDQVTTFQDSQFVADLETSLNSFNGAPSEATSSAVISSIQALNQELESLGGSPLQANVGIGLTLGDSGQKFGWTLYTSGTARAGTLFNYNDGDFLSGFADAIDLVDFDNPANNTAALLDSLGDYVTYDVDDVTGEITNIQAVPYSGDDIQSSVDLMGLGAYEVGLSLATDLGGMAFGVTPKFVQVKFVDYSANPESADVEDFGLSDYQAEYEHFNVDIGFARELTDGWTVGFVGKNLIEQKYEGLRRNPDTQLFEPTGNVVTSSPTFQVGVAQQTDWGLFAVDYDLQETEGFNGLPGSQFLSSGIELDAAGWGQIRAGYRANLSDSERSVLSAGIGFSPFGVHVDLAVAGSENELGVAAQFGFRF